jgi:hypothetical protein
VDAFLFELIDQGGVSSVRTAICCWPDSLARLLF